MAIRRRPGFGFSPALLSLPFAALLFTACGDSSGPDPLDEIASVTVTPSQVTVDVASTTQLQATVKNGHGETVTAQVNWASSSQSVATVDASGVVTGVAEGACNVTASAAGHSAAASVSVNDPFPPQQPTNLTAAPVSNTEIQVTWTDNAGNEDEFRIQREEVGGGEAADGDGPDRAYSQVGSVGPNVTSYNDTGLQSNTAYRYRVTACNENGCSEPVAMAGDVTTYPQLAIATTSLPGTDMGAAYSQTVTASGGNGSYTWSVIAGDLPDGLSMDSGSGLISGTPSAEGTFTFTVQVQSADGQTATKELAIEIVFVFNCSFQSEIPETECEALVALYEGTNGPTWNNPSGWLANLTPCSWAGVTCSGGSVSELRLRNSGLSGPLPPEIGDLTGLQVLRLSHNDLPDALPAQLANLLELRRVELEGNDFTGSIPAGLGNLTHLTHLNLAGNDLTGSIPPELGNLTNLEYLDFEHNELTGSIPPELGNLTKLNRLTFRYCDLSGAIPAELGNLVDLTWLMLGSNQLSGPVPASFAGLTKLRFLDLGNNELTGGVPSYLGTFPDLEWLSMANNQLTGSIPAALGSLVKLTNLYLDGNQLTGGIPSELAGLPELEWLLLDNNQLDGSIPSGFGGLMHLEGLTLDSNQLSGGIPGSLGSLTEMTMLGLSGNQLTGTLPAELGNLGKLKYLNLHENQLTGSIPATFGNLISLESISLNDNQLSGIIPLSVAQLGGLIQQVQGTYGCKFLPGNGGLSLPDTQDYRDADLDGDGYICLVPFPPAPLTMPILW